MPDIQKHVLFVCSGNTARSAMAAAWFNADCLRRGRRGLSAESAGINSRDGMPIAADAVTALAEQHLLPARLGSRRLTPKIILSADLVVAMTSQHRDHIVEWFPRLRLRTVVLMAYANRTGDLQVPDPAGGGLPAYRDCLARMQPALTVLADELAEG